MGVSAVAGKRGRKAPEYLGGNVISDGILKSIRSGERIPRERVPSTRRLARELLAARKRIAELEHRLPCGHRAIDWDDSYGGCVACAWRKASLTLELLPDELCEQVDAAEEKAATVLRAELENTNG